MTLVWIYAAIGATVGAYALCAMNAFLKTAPQKMKTPLYVAATITTLSIAALWPISTIGVLIIKRNLARRAKGDA